jgi:lambda family phage tail tape measure protein
MSTEERAIQLSTSVDATGAREGLAEVSREAGAMAASVERSSRQAGSAAAGIGAGAQTSSRNVEAAQRNLIGSIQRTTAALEAGSRTGSAYYEVLARQRGVDPSVLEPYLAQLRAIEATQQRANTAVHGAAPALNDVGMSARATAAALRGVPAQVTDIVTSLQGGQAPLTVFLQQGGQLRDMFGSAGGAARALGGYMLGLVSPYTVAAAAAVGLAVAYHQGSDEADAYRAAITSSGNAAGASADHLKDMAREISNSVGTQHAAAEALAAMVATGKVSSDNLERFSEVAVKGQRAFGQSVQETASQFAELARTPIQALDKLNEKYHFVTGALYEQVKALQEQGRTYEAGQVAQRAYANAFADAAKKAEGNLGSLERGWVKVKDIAKGAWDAMLGVGREDTLEENLTKVRAAIAKASDPHAFGSLDAQGHLQQNIELEASLQRQIVSRDHQARLSADQSRFNDADLAWSQSKEQYMTRAERLQNDLAKAQQMGLDAGVSDIEINRRLLAVRQQYSEIYNDGIDAQIESLRRREAIEDAITQRTLMRINASRAAGSITEDTAISQTADAELTQMGRRRAGLVEELNLSKLKINSQKAQQDLTGQIAALDKQTGTRREQLELELFAAEQRRYRQAVENTANVIESAQAERENLRRQVQSQHDYNEEIGLTASELADLRAARLEELAVQKDAAAVTAEGLDLTGEQAAVYRAQAQALRDLAAAGREGFVKQRDPWANLQASVRRYGDEASNVGAQIGDAMTNAFRGAEDAFVGFVTTGKASFSDLARSILADLARIEARQAIAGIGSYLLDGLGSLFGPGTIGDLGGARANGGPVNSGVPYLVGERGPEIFTPRSSGTIIPNHELGGSGGVQISLTTYVSSSGSETKTSGSGGPTAQALADGLNAKFKSFLAQEIRQGGMIWNFQMRGAL